VISTGSPFNVGAYQNGRDGASGTGRSARETGIEMESRPSSSRRTCLNSPRLISSSVFPPPWARIASSQRVPIFVADSTAELKLIEFLDTNADRRAVPVT